MKTIKYIRKKKGVAVGDVKRVANVVARNNIASGYAEEVSESEGANQKAETPAKPLSKMNTAELEAYAADHSIDLATAKNNAERRDLIEKAEAKAGQKQLSEYSLDELKAYALEKEIDLGTATEPEDILELLENLAPLT
jgi:hypothetical protein